MSVLKQDHFAFDEYTVLETIIMGNPRLAEIAKEKDALYAKPDFSDEDGIRAGELEGEFAELNGWEAESDASKLIQGLGLSEDILYQPMSSLPDNEKIKVLLAQASVSYTHLDVYKRQVASSGVRPTLSLLRIPRILRSLR